MKRIEAWGWRASLFAAIGGFVDACQAERARSRPLCHIVRMRERRADGESPRHSAGGGTGACEVLVPPARTRVGRGARRRRLAGASGQNLRPAPRAPVRPRTPGPPRWRLAYSVRASPGARSGILEDSPAPSGGPIIIPRQHLQFITSRCYPCLPIGIAVHQPLCRSGHRPVSRTSAVDVSAWLKKNQLRDGLQFPTVKGFGMVSSTEICENKSDINRTKQCNCIIYASSTHAKASRSSSTMWAHVWHVAQCNLFQNQRPKKRATEFDVRNFRSFVREQQVYRNWKIWFVSVPAVHFAGLQLHNIQGANPPEGTQQ
jgi:hypothetical protein